MHRVKRNGFVTIEATVITSIYIIGLAGFMLLSFNKKIDIENIAKEPLNKPVYTVYQILSIKHIGGDIYESFRK